MKVEEKVPGGKLLRMELDSGGRIIISGDFFLHPEDSLEGIEKILFEMKGKGENEVEKRLDEFAREERIQMIGFSARDLAGLFRRLSGGRK